MIQCILMAIYTLMRYSLWALKYHWNVQFPRMGDAFWNDTELYAQLGVYLANAGYVGISYTRWWLLFFMIKTSSALNDSKWKNIIDPRNEENDWYLKHQRNCGSWYYMRWP